MITPDHSFLSEQLQLVMVRSVSLPPMVCTCGVPQGSAFEPILYTTFSQIIARLANLLFDEGVFSRKFKTAQLTTLLKKPGLDEAEAANYRPISNLITISKAIEQLYLTLILPHVAQSSNYNPLQSAYRKMHST